MASIHHSDDSSPCSEPCLSIGRAILYFQDEANISLTAYLGKTWGLRGVTPIATVSGLRESITALSAISSHGALIFQLLQKRVASAEFIDFLQQMLRHHSHRHLVVVTDRATPHISKITKTFIEEQKRLHVFYLPPYSPKCRKIFTADEKVWNYLKTQALKSHQARSEKELEELVQKKLDIMSSDPHLLKALYFRCCIADFYVDLRRSRCCRTFVESYKLGERTSKQNFETKKRCFT